MMSHKCFMAISETLQANLNANVFWGIAQKSDFSNYE